MYFSPMLESLDWATEVCLNQWVNVFRNIGEHLVRCFSALQ